VLSELLKQRRSDVLQELVHLRERLDALINEGQRV
jgi:hypothetical protein